VTGSSWQNFAWEGDLFAAYSHDEDVVALVSLSQENLAVTGTIEVNDEINSCWIHDEYIYICDNYFRIFDIREPSNPKEIEQEVRIYPNRVTGSGDFIWACGNNPMLFIIDVSNPEEPTIIHRLNMTSYPYEIAVNGSSFYVRTLNGLALFDCSAILSTKGGDEVMLAELLGLTISPNPFNAFATVRYELPAPGWVKLSLYDLSGRLVEKLVDGEMPAGRHAIELDGSELAAGVYFVRLETRSARGGRTSRSHTQGNNSPVGGTILSRQTQKAVMVK
jgi:hypothetical protein